jgi:uncharacterized membrane protein
MGTRSESRLRFHAGAIAVLAVLGLGVSGYLLYEHYCAPIACIGTGCALVDASPYSEIFGVPLSALGLLSYGAILGLSLGGVRPHPHLRPRLHGGPGAWPLFLGIFGIALTGVLFSAYLTYVELAIIRAVCSWCVTSAVLITAIFAIALHALRTTPAPAGLELG